MKPSKFTKPKANSMSNSNLHRGLARLAGLACIALLAAAAVTSCKPKTNAKFSSEQIAAWLDSIPVAQVCPESHIVCSTTGGGRRMYWKEMSAHLSEAPQYYYYVDMPFESEGYVENEDGTKTYAAHADGSTSSGYIKAVRLPVRDEAGGAWYAFVGQTYLLVAYWNGTDLHPELEQYNVSDDPDITFVMDYYLYADSVLHVHTKRHDSSYGDPSEGWQFYSEYYLFGEGGKILPAYDYPQPFDEFVAQIKAVKLPQSDKTLSTSLKGVTPLPRYNAYLRSDYSIKGDGLAQFYALGQFKLADGTVCIFGNYVSAADAAQGRMNDPRLYAFTPQGAQIDWWWLTDEDYQETSNHWGMVWDISAKGLFSRATGYEINNPYKNPAPIESPEREVQYKYLSAISKIEVRQISLEGFLLKEIREFEYRDDFFDASSLRGFFATVDDGFETYKFLFCLPGSENVSLFAHIYKEDGDGFVRLMTCTPAGKVIDACYVPHYYGIHNLTWEPDESRLMKRLPEENTCYCDEDGEGESYPDGFKMGKMKVLIDHDYYFITPAGKIERPEDMEE